MNDPTLWAMAQLYIARDLPVPIDLLAEADRRGLMLTEFDQPRNSVNEEESHNGTIKKEDIYDGPRDFGLRISDTA
jgi:hypothetical protein